MRQYDFLAQSGFPVWQSWQNVAPPGGIRYAGWQRPCGNSCANQVSRPAEASLLLTFEKGSSRQRWYRS